MMALHFERTEFDARRDRLMIEMAEKKLDAMLLFAQESMYWLTGYDTFGFCFFQMPGASRPTARWCCSPARPTSGRRGTPRSSTTSSSGPTATTPTRRSTCAISSTISACSACAIGVEYDTHGLTAFNGRRLDEQLTTFGQIVDASGIVSRLRLFKSPAEINKAEKAAALADDALDAALPLIKQGGDEAD